MLESDLVKHQLQSTEISNKPDSEKTVLKISAECKDLYDKYWRLYSNNWTEYEKQKVIDTNISR
jgi:hypothetical protein